MKRLGIRFPGAAETACANAEEYSGLTMDERLDRLLALKRAVEAIVAARPDRERLAAEQERRKDEELGALVAVQVRGHV